LTDLALTPNSRDPSTTDMAGLLMVEKELQMELESAVGEAGAKSYVVRAEPEACILAPTNCPLLPRAPRCLRPNA
jgi:hypothetical protein